MRFFLLLGVLSIFFDFNAQCTFTGSVTEDATRQPVIGARISLIASDGTVKKAATNTEGKFTYLALAKGKYTIQISMISFDTIRESITIEKPLVTQSYIIGGSKELDEIRLISNLVKDNQNVPVAITKISLQKITEELASRDLPMLLNGTAGVYATQTGGGDGDARINVRGFDQRNVGVMMVELVWP